MSEMIESGMRWIVEADIKSFFDSLDRRKLHRMLKIRIDDKRVCRLVGKCLNAGVIDGESYNEQASTRPLQLLWSERKRGSLRQVLFQAERAWYKWLQRRSQRGRRLTWQRFQRYLRTFPLPQTRVFIQILGLSFMSLPQRKSRMEENSTYGSERAPAGSPAGATRAADIRRSDLSARS